MFRAFEYGHIHQNLAPLPVSITAPINQFQSLHQESTPLAGIPLLLAGRTKNIVKVR